MSAKRGWIQQALGRTKAERRAHRGALRRQLGLPARGAPIPRARLEWAARQGGKLGRRARLALVLRRLGGRRKHRGGR